jgi:D-tyrosyl-tRNA(Tyr) deacylase
MLVVSQFTLFADVRKGRRPDFTGAAKPEAAVLLYRTFVDAVERRLITPAADPRPQVVTGDFGTTMRVTLANEGPVTILIDSGELKAKKKG